MVFQILTEGGQQDTIFELLYKQSGCVLLADIGLQTSILTNTSHEL